MKVVFCEKETNKRLVYKNVKEVHTQRDYVTLTLKDRTYLKVSFERFERVDIDND